jgi:hypothetical protein
MMTFPTFVVVTQHIQTFGNLWSVSTLRTSTHNTVRQPSRTVDHIGMSVNGVKPAVATTWQVNAVCRY